MKGFWYALHVNSRCQASLQSAIPTLGFEAECLAPMRITERKIPSRPSPIKSRVLAFSNYILVRFEFTPERFHKLIGLHGCYGFVQFGGGAPVAIPQEQIDKLKAALDSFTRGAAVIGDDEQDRMLNIVVSEHSAAARNAGFHMFLQVVEQQARSRKSPRANAHGASRPKPIKLTMAY